MAKTRKCKTCGRPFEPKARDDHFCSALCRTTGCFVAGGGDTSKPMSAEMRKAMERKGKTVGPSPKTEERTRLTRNGAEKFPRVHYMFSLPVAQRYEVSKNFSREEQEYARRLAKKMLMEERKFDEAAEWDFGCEERESFGSSAGIAGGSLGDSDDGTI